MMANEPATRLSKVFIKESNFRGATFTERADFEGATFTKSANFEDATFTHMANFGGATGTAASLGSGGDRDWRGWIVGGLEFLSEAGTERAIVDGATNLKQQIGAASRPPHLL